MAWPNEPVTSGLAVPVNPMWLSLTCAKRSVGRVSRGGGGAGDVRDDLAADDGQPDRRTEPRTVPDELPPAHGRGVAFLGHGVTTTLPCMNGWIEQT